jgi:hypothetical protein
MDKTMIVGSPEHKEHQKEQIRSRIIQAIEEISDDAVFTPDQQVKLNNAFVIIRWAIEEAL